jgi:hypothetical protein
VGVAILFSLLIGGDITHSYVCTTKLKGRGYYVARVGNSTWVRPDWQCLDHVFVFRGYRQKKGNMHVLRGGESARGGVGVAMDVAPVWVAAPLVTRVYTRPSVPSETHTSPSLTSSTAKPTMSAQPA